MSRKMMKEERILRDALRFPEGAVDYRRFSIMIKHLVRACYEDAAFRVRCASAGEPANEVGTAEHAIIYHWGYKKEDDPEAAIRGRK